MSKTGPKIGHKQSAYTVAKRMRTRWNHPPTALGRLQQNTVFVQRDDDLGECWIWTGAIGAKGYGMINMGGGKVELVHRVAYRERFGDIPEGHQIDHLCSVRRCWRHLEAVTGQENMRRWREKLHATAA